MDSINQFIRDFVTTWIAPYATELQTTWIGLAIVTYSILTSGLLQASYGRHHSKSSFIPDMNGKLGWMLMEIVSPITVMLFFRSYKLPDVGVSKGKVLLGLWLFHYTNRAILSVVLSPRM